MVRTFSLFLLTAIAEIVGCYLPYLWLRNRGSVWLLIPAAGALVAFVFLLSLHPTAAGRVYAAYGGVYIAVALAWLRIVNGVTPRLTDIVGVAFTLTGMAIIILGERSR